jgi:hypothetical protein
VTSTVIATTRSGSRYVILVEEDGARWVRLPASHRSQPMVGWLGHPPKVVSGERMMLGDVRSTPVVRVAFLPGPEPPSARLLRADLLRGAGMAARPQPWSLRSLLGGQRH